MEKICQVSNPEIVLKQLKKYYGDDVDLYLSSSKNKKRRQNFRNRNRRWADTEKYSPAHLSYYLLW